MQIVPERMLSRGMSGVGEGGGRGGEKKVGRGSILGQPGAAAICGPNRGDEPLPGTFKEKKEKRKNVYYK